MQVAGYNFEFDALDKIGLGLEVRDQQRSSESALFLLPTATSGVWKSSDVILSTPLRNYSVDDYPQLYDDIGHPEGRLKVIARKCLNIFENVKNIEKYHICDIFKILPLYIFRCSFNHVYRANAVFIEFICVFF